MVVQIKYAEKSERNDPYIHTRAHESGLTKTHYPLG
jgi:hypothetical protein